MERMMNCIVVIDHEGKIRKFNKTAEETFGYSCGEILGEMFSDKIIAIAQATEFAEGLKRFVEMGEWDLLDRRVEFKMRRAGGGEFPVEMELTALMHNKQPIFIVYLYDITSWLQSEDKI
ncbi:MAG: PAS domain S-box protein, partial [Bacteriovoracaceae bacterium]|nr:PAS domain S-box protein [Bacteriovoracaceae bacterium]